MNVIVLVKSGKYSSGYLFLTRLPGLLDNSLVTLLLIDLTAAVAAVDLVDLLLCLADELLLFRRDRHIRNRYGDCTQCRILVSGCLDIIQNLGCLGCAVNSDTLVDDLL